MLQAYESVARVRELADLVVPLHEAELPSGLDPLCQMVPGKVFSAKVGRLFILSLGDVRM